MNSTPVTRQPRRAILEHETAHAAADIEHARSRLYPQEVQVNDL